MPEAGLEEFCRLDPEETCILYYHGNDWAGVPSRQRYLMTAMSHSLPIFYLDGGRDAAGRVTWHTVSDRIKVIRGLVRIFQFFDRTGLRSFKAAYARWALRSIRQRHRRIIFWTAENWFRPYRFIPHDFLVFDSIDPCFDETPEVLNAFYAREEEVLASADVVFASAASLVERCRESHPNVTLLNNACEPGEYSDQLIAAARRPSWWPDTGRPIGAYLGSLDWRLDVASMHEACVQNPDVHFVLAGNIVPGAVPELTRLLALPNVTAPGRISVEDGRYLLAQCAFGLIPFITGSMNDAVNPVKMYAYALLGKPVLGTAVRELVDRPEVAQVAPDPVAFGQMVPDVLLLAKNPAHQSYLRRFALDNTWEKRAETAWNVLRQSLPIAQPQFAIQPHSV